MGWGGWKRTEVGATVSPGLPAPLGQPTLFKGTGERAVQVHWNKAFPVLKALPSHALQTPFLF